MHLFLCQNRFQNRFQALLTKRLKLTILKLNLDSVKKNYITTIEFYSTITLKTTSKLHQIMKPKWFRNEL